MSEEYFFSNKFTVQKEFQFHRDSTFARILSDEFILSIIVPIVDYVNEKGVELTVEEVVFLLCSSDSKRIHRIAIDPTKRVLSSRCEKCSAQLARTLKVKLCPNCLKKEADRFPLSLKKSVFPGLYEGKGRLVFQYYKELPLCVGVRNGNRLDDVPPNCPYRSTYIDKKDTSLSFDDCSDSSEEEGIVYY